MRCPHCTQPIPDESSFCPQCQQRIEWWRRPQNAKLLSASIIVLSIVGGLLQTTGLLDSRPRFAPVATTVPVRTRTSEPPIVLAASPTSVGTFTALPDATETHPAPTTVVTEPSLASTAVPPSAVPTDRAADTPIPGCASDATIDSKGDPPRVFVRSGPGTNYEPLTKVTHNDHVTILYRNGPADWLYIRTPQGTTGWVSADFVISACPAASYPVTATPPPPTNTPTGSRTDPHFHADEAIISKGNCTYLRWDVDNINAVYLDGYPKAGHGSERVCPGATQTFTLTVVERDGRKIEWKTMVTIDEKAPTPAAQFQIEYDTCIGHNLRVGSVKGQIFNRSGGIIVGAVVEILVEGQAGVVPLGRTNADGWYEFNLTPGHRVTFVRLEINGRNVPFTPDRFEVKAQSGCYQRVDFRQK